MSKKFTEIVIEGPFVLVKGFLMGFLYGSQNEFEYFFHRKSGIRRETLKEFLMEVFDFENYVHLCIEQDVHNNFLKAIEKSSSKIGLKVKSVNNIKSASFDFKFELFNQQLGDKAEKLFTDLNNQVDLKNYKPVKTIRDDAVGIEGYAPEHSFIFTGSGTAQGDFANIMQNFVAIKRSDLSDVISCGDIQLEMEK